MIFTSQVTTHRHPSIYHLGDEPHKLKDWGLHQVKAFFSL